MLEDGETDADFEDVDDSEEGMDEEEREDRREDAKVDKVWLATLDVYLAMVISPLSTLSSALPAPRGGREVGEDAERTGIASVFLDSCIATAPSPASVSLVADSTSFGMCWSRLRARLTRRSDRRR